MEAKGVMYGGYVVWTQKETKIISVERDSHWEKANIPLLQDFYLSELLPQVLGMTKYDASKNTKERYLKFTLLS